MNFEGLGGSGTVTLCGVPELGTKGKGSSVSDFPGISCKIKNK